MNNPSVHVLGVHSSPIPHGNCAFLLHHALQEAQTRASVTTEEIALTNLRIADCLHCNWCVRRQTAEQPCRIEDDALPILRKMKDCDVLVLATPVYFARLSGVMACLIDRTRCYIFGHAGRITLRGKVGVALAVGWEQHGGIETTLESLHYAFLSHEMWAPSLHAAGNIFGVGAVTGPFDEARLHHRPDAASFPDEEALHKTKLLMRKAIQTARALKQGTSNASL